VHFQPYLPCLRHLGLGFVALMALAGGALAGDDPESVFHQPPESAKPGVWWHWMGSNVSKEGITRDLEAFKSAGIGSATIFGMADICVPWAAHIENSRNDGLPGSVSLHLMHASTVSPHQD